MLDRFLKYCNTEKLLVDSDKVLLAVSGGIDSISMLHLFYQAGIEFGVAHCNFQLRGKEAEEDQEFVKSLTESIEKPFYTIRFDTHEYAARQKISIQMAARDLRYEWFKKIASENNFTKIATAHNLDDVVETTLLNIARGTGIRGLTGIAPIKGNIIRPLLFASRSEIEEYHKLNHFKFREDSSNAEIKYKRNLVRHEIIPLFKKLNPSFSETVIHETKLFQSVATIYQNKLDKVRDSLLKFEGEKIFINIKALLYNQIDSSLLFDILEPYGFTFSDSNEIIHSVESQAGKKFISQSHILVKDRENFIMVPITEKIDEEYFIEETDITIEIPIKLKLSHRKNTPDFIVPKDQQSIAIDADRVKYPFILRHWKAGDFFYPLGTKGRKKISDFFTDRKIPLTEKDQIWILASGDKILWIIGYQIDERVKLTDSTENILLIERIG